MRPPALHVEHVALAQQLLGPRPSPRMVRLSNFEITWNEIRVGKLALIVPVITSTEGRWVAMITWMPAARAICARRCTADSISLPATIIRSAISSITTTRNGRGAQVEALLLEHRLAGLAVEAGLHAARDVLAAGAPPSATRSL